MNSNNKKIISVVGVAIILVIAVYGTFMPWHKSSLYISASRSSQTVTTLREFEDTLSPALEATSPIGQNELVRNVAGSVLTIVRNGGENKELIKASIDYVTSYYQPILTYGKGPSFAQDLYVMGLITESAYIGTLDPQYLSSAQQYYEAGYERGPKRPQFLYGLFDTYRFANNAAGTDKIAKEILTYWPDDTAIKAQYDKFLAKQASSTATSTNKK